MYSSVHLKNLYTTSTFFKKFSWAKLIYLAFCLGVGWKYSNSSFRLNKNAITSPLHLFYPKRANLAPVYTVLSTAVTCQDNQVSIPPKPFAYFLSSLGIDALERRQCSASAHTTALHVWFGLYHDFFMQKGLK